MVLFAVLVGQLAEHDRHLAVLARAVNDEDRLAARRKTVFRGGEISGGGYVRAVQPDDDIAAAKSRVARRSAVLHGVDLHAAAQLTV